MISDTPSIASSAYASNTFALNAAGGLQGAQAAVANAAIGGLNKQLHQQIFNPPAGVPSNRKETPMSARRLVKVVIVDPNENVPLEDCVLFSGDEKLTDATDQELFFEIDIKKVLEEHNAKRVKVLDKKVKERSEYLEPAKIRDLKMVVVNIATF